MKRVIKPFASGTRVYPAGAILPDDHPAVRAGSLLFEDVPAVAPAQPAETSEDPAGTSDGKPEAPEPPKATGRKTTAKKDGAGADGGA